MSRRTAWFLHASTLAVGVTGLVYAWMLYFATPTDEFAVVNHPWQPSFQWLHIISAPLLVFGVGLLWESHIWARFRSGFRARRRTGLVLGAAVAPMVMSGYLLQVTTDELWQTVWVWIHVISSLLWLPGYALHQFSKRHG